MISYPITRLVLTFTLITGFSLSSFPDVRAGDADQGGGQFPTAELSELPYLYFSRNNLGEACIFRMRQDNDAIEIDGELYVGFRFLSTGLIEWLFINTPGELEPGDWILINEHGEQVGRVERENIPLANCPRVVARYPQAERVTRYHTVGEELEERGRYFLIQKAGSDEPGQYAISLSSRSPGSYEAGRSGQLIRRISDPPLRDSSDVVIENMKDIRDEEGVEAAMEYLAREMELRIDDLETIGDDPESQRRRKRPGFTSLYLNAWSEAQTGGGRTDSYWASEVYGVMYEVCMKRGYFARLSVGTNLTGSLSSAGRFGRLAELCESLKEGMRLGGYRLETASYPDRGPAFGVLPQVRKRDIPYLAPFSQADQHGIKVRSRPSSLSSNFIGGIENYAHQLWYQGNWRESLEWLVWVNGWASDPKHGGPGNPHKGFAWHGSRSSIASKLSNLGFWDEALALHEDAQKQEINGGYEGMFIVLHQMRVLTLKMELDRDLPEDSLDQARACIARAEGNLYVRRTTVLNYKTNLARLLLHQGHTSEGEALLDELAEEGYRVARIVRLRHWVKTGRTAGVEDELRSLLEQSREGGRKMDEIVFYRIYADFLEQDGRLNEALWVRRELVRLCRAFDIFTYLPVELAKLSDLLNKLAIRDESFLIAEQARELVGVGGIPNRLARQTIDILDAITPGATIASEVNPARLVDFQPLHSVVIPLKGASWVSHLTLANPSGTEQSGTLQSTGLPVRFQEVDCDVHILATLGGQDGDLEMNVRIDPASYKIIALSAARDFADHGPLSLMWTPDDGEEFAKSEIMLEESIGGATTAIIQAGAYKLNPFYGIPVYHHYLDTEQAEQSLPMRFVSSQTARIEIYAMDGTPIAIDAQGNGSLRDAGDELFGRGDGQGNLLLPLTEGGASFMILIYPQQALPEEGLSLRIECLEGDQWELYAEDRLMPATAGD